MSLAWSEHRSPERILAENHELRRRLLAAERRIPRFPLMPVVMAGTGFALMVWMLWRYAR